MCITNLVNGNKTRQECATQDEMNKTAMLENERRFSRALQGAFMQSPLQQLFDNAGNKEPATSEVLQGTFQSPPNIDFYAKLLLEAMQIPPNIPKLSTKDTAWTKKDLQEPWQKQNTKTSCESSMLPFSHHMANTYHDQLLEVDTILHSIPFERGLSPRPWEAMTDFKLLKKPGVHDVELMRTIILTAAQYNMKNA